MGNQTNVFECFDVPVFFEYGDVFYTTVKVKRGEGCKIVDKSPKIFRYFNLSGLVEEAKIVSLSSVGFEDIKTFDLVDFFVELSKDQLLRLTLSVSLDEFGY